MAPKLFSLALLVALARGSTTACSPTSWTGFLNEVCGSCAALVKVRDIGGDCSTFCALQGLGCVQAWDDETDDECSFDAPKLSCYHSFALSGSKDAICECDPHTAAAACSPRSWTGFDNEVCGSCAALVKVRDNGGDCSTFCARQGLGCVQAWDDTDDECSFDAPKLSCYHNFPPGGSSDAICECDPHIAPPPMSPPPTPPAPPPDFQKTVEGQLTIGVGALVFMLACMLAVGLVRSADTPCRSRR